MNKDAYSLLRSLFFNRLIPLEAKSKEEMVFEKQLHIKEMMDKVESFIKKTPNSEFEVRVLEKNSEDLENLRVSLIFKTYEYDEKPHRVDRYLITIDYNFNSVTFYQWALNNVLLPL